MLRLVAYAPDGVRRFPVRRRQLVIGSEPECDICLPYTGVSHRHAQVLYDGEELRIEDLGSRRGVLVKDRKVKEAALEVLDEIRVGAVTLLVEDVVPEALTPSPDIPARQSLGESRMTPEFLLDHVSRLSEWVLSDVQSRTTSEKLLTEVLRDFGGGVLFLIHGLVRADSEEGGIKLVVSTDPTWLGSGEGLLTQARERFDGDPQKAKGGCFTGELDEHETWICFQRYRALERDYVLLTALPRFRPDKWSPVSALRAVGDLLILGMVHHVGTYEPILPGKLGGRDLTLDPELVVGESETMQRLMGKMRSVADKPIHLLLRGEPGVGKAQVARSIHLSGGRPDGPFVMANCTGASPQQLEADIFGAEIPGRDGPVRREGKLLLADGGTLFLSEIEELPLELQTRLVRFMRSGRVEAVGSAEVRSVEVRLIAASRGPLEPAIARDRFRVDLAYRLSQFAIDVPALRDRIEDLPLIIQRLVNRFCHETGKRMQGITVKAMSVLAKYDYPGNLAELENIVRQMIYLCPSGQPIGTILLPEAVRLRSLQTSARVDPGSDLELDRLVSSTEAVAIVEALRRTQGNKSQAARLLRLSRNGLAMKMERYGLKA